MTTQDHRQSAEARIHELVDLVKSHPDIPNHAALTDECESLERAIRAFHMEGIRFRMYNVDRLLFERAIRAFHMEGIRFRMYNVDRLLSRATQAPENARAMLEDARRHLEAAGFHTRSHQAPT